MRPQVSPVFTHYRPVTVNKDTDSGVIHGDVRSQHSSYSSSDDQYPQPFWSDVRTSPAVNEAPGETEMMKLNPLNVIVGEEASVTRSWVGWMIISQFYANSFRWFVEQFARWVDGEWAADSSELEYNFWLLETSGNYTAVPNVELWRISTGDIIVIGVYFDLFWNMWHVITSNTVLINWINMMSGQKN